ncbi:MAG: sigma-54 dependent transcriptional regulator [Chitinispirillia bacterium]|jgi:DNA-binding NtrC family response regulator
MIPYSILIVEDNESTIFGYEECLSEQNYSITSAQTLLDARKQLDRKAFDIILLDLNLPDGNSLDWISKLRQVYPIMGIIVITGDDSVTKAVTAMKNGADNYLTKPVDPGELAISIKKCLELKSLRKRDVTQKNINSRIELYFGKSEVIQERLEYAEMSASNDSIVLLQGETGTGKGVFAQWIHDHSNRNDQPFVALNCSMLKGDLLRSELYGHTKGAFTSAHKDRQGFIEAADGGTLFLDEIGDMDLEVQAQLLKTIEEKSFRRIGENKLRFSDFRLICASHRDLNQLAKTGQFRQDLYYRLCVFPIVIPSLRERTEDIEGLSESILQSLGYDSTLLNTEIIELLQNYDYPGNIRELRNMLERAIILSRRGPLLPSHFPGIASPYEIIDTLMTFNRSNKLPTLESLEKEYILYVLKQNSWDKKKTVDILGISRSSLYRKIPELSE